MIRLFLVRHGETDWNVTQRFQGQTDIPLNESGRQQAAAIAKRLASEEIHAIYASDLSRAWETAQAISSQHACGVAAEPRLREGSFGEWEGLTYAEIEERQPEAVEVWREDIENFTPQGGESPHQLAVRVSAVYKDIYRKHTDETVLLVAHGGSLQMLVCQLLGLPPGHFWQFHLDHCSLSTLSIYEAGAIINLLNDTSHLTVNAER